MEIMLRKCGSAAVELVTPDKYKGFVKGILEVVFLLWFTYCVSQVESNFSDMRNWFYCYIYCRAAAITRKVVRKLPPQMQI